MGIGEATARALANAGANLILLSRSEVSIISTHQGSSNIETKIHDTQDKLSKLTDELSKQHPQIKVIYRTADVGNYEEVDAAVDSSVKELGGIDILINNVRSSPNPAIIKLSQAVYRETSINKSQGRTRHRRTKRLPQPQNIRNPNNDLNKRQRPNVRGSLCAKPQYALTQSRDDHQRHLGHRSRSTSFYRRGSLPFQ